MRIPHFVLAVSALAFAPQLAHAHTKLVSSAPAADATVSAPAKIELRFNEAVIGSTLSAGITMTGMAGMANHGPTPITGFTTQIGKDRKSMTLLLRRPLTAGTYRINWSAAGADTHRMGGEFSFTVR